MPADYHSDISHSQKDGGYIANIQDLRACSAFGKTPEEALREVQRAQQAKVPPPKYRPAIYQASA